MHIMWMICHGLTRAVDEGIGDEYGLTYIPFLLFDGPEKRECAERAPTIQLRPRISSTMHVPNGFSNTHQLATGFTAECETRVARHICCGHRLCQPQRADFPQPMSDIGFIITMFFPPLVRWMSLKYLSHYADSAHHHHHHHHRTCVSRVPSTYHSIMLSHRLMHPQSRSWLRKYVSPQQRQV